MKENSSLDGDDEDPELQRPNRSRDLDDETPLRDLYDDDPRVV